MCGWGQGMGSAAPVCLKHVRFLIATSGLKTPDQHMRRRAVTGARGSCLLKQTALIRLPATPEQASCRGQRPITQFRSHAPTRLRGDKQLGVHCTTPSRFERNQIYLWMYFNVRPENHRRPDIPRNTAACGFRTDNVADLETKMWRWRGLCNS